MSYDYDDDFGKGCLSLICILIIIIIVIGSCALNESNEREVTVTVTEKGIKNYNKNGMYLVYCKDATGNVCVYKIKDSLMQGKFNSSDIYASIEVGKTYTFLVRGNRIELTSSYPNIVRIVDVEEE